MTHTSGDVTTHMLELIKRFGTTGTTGPTQAKHFSSKQNIGTGHVAPLGPVELGRSQPFSLAGTNNVTKKQILLGPVTGGTGGTAIFKEGPHQLGSDGVLAEWHAILQDLSAAEPVSGFSYGRWRGLIDDGETFLRKWSLAAFEIGWTALDLFGVHPTAPAARYDVMGLIPMLNRADVISLTDSAATMRRESGAVLTYRRQHQADAVLLSQLLLSSRAKKEPEFDETDDIYLEPLF